MFEKGVNSSIIYILYNHFSLNANVITFSFEKIHLNVYIPDR